MPRIHACTLVLACFGLLAGNSGCVTSSEFKVGTSVVTPSIVKVANRYAAKDEAKKAQIQRLTDDTKSREEISRPAVANSWAAIKAWYYPAVEAENEPETRMQYREYGTTLDRLIAEDEARPLKFLGK